MKQILQKRLIPTLAGVIVLLLLAKYFWSMYLFPDVPFGYDAGIYRYLFIRHAEGFPPFDAAGLPQWAKAHAPGLFFFSSLFMHLGVSADMLIGWVWNMFPVVSALALALVVRRRHGDLVGFFVLLAAFLSTVQYEGFLMIYQKTFVALLWCSLAFFAFESASLLWIPLGMLAIATHQQIGLIFIVAVGSAILSSIFLRHQPVPLRRVGEFCLTIILGLLWYLPTYERSLQDLAPQLLASGTLFMLIMAVIVVGGFGALLLWLPQKNRRLLWALSAAGCIVMLSLVPALLDSPSMLHRLLTPPPDAVSGAFLSLTEYLKLSFPLLLAGITGLMLSIERERGTVWQWAALWCAVASLGMFFFYRRFILPFDFFLLPFAAIAFAALWKYKTAGRTVLIILVAVQGALLLHRMSSIDPIVKPAWLTDFAALHESVPDGSTVVVMDNMAPWILGHLPHSSVSGPGIFDSLPLSEWEKFLLGPSSDRTQFFNHYTKGTFFYVTDVFREYYPPDVQSVLQHPCLQQTDTRGLYRLVCGAEQRRPA